MPLLAFWILALIAVLCAMGLVLRRNPIHGALFLVGNLGSIAGLFLLARAEFLAAVQIIVYAGAIAVLFVFAIMVLIPGKDETGPDPNRPQRWLAVPLGGLLALEVALIGRSVLWSAPPRTTTVDGTAQGVGRLLFTDYLFPFEVTSFLLLAAMVGVMALTKRRA